MAVRRLARNADAKLSPPALSFRSRRATRPIIYWSTGRKHGEGDDAAAAQQGAAAANGDANGAAAAAEDEDLSPEEQKRRARRGGLDLDAIVDLSELDLSILQRPARMPPFARVSCCGWHARSSRLALAWQHVQPGAALQCCSRCCSFSNLPGQPQPAPPHWAPTRCLLLMPLHYALNYNTCASRCMKHCCPNFLAAEAAGPHVAAGAAGPRRPHRVAGGVQALTRLGVGCRPLGWAEHAAAAAGHATAFACWACGSTCFTLLLCLAGPMYLR